MSIFTIEARFNGTWEDRGQAVIPEYANPRLVEHCLLHITVPVFAPHGSDRLVWNYKTGNGVIYNADKQPIVRLTRSNMRIVR